MKDETLPKVYEPHEVEARLYPIWEKKGYFQAEIVPGRTPFTIVIPPPNVTGSLHMGHALNNTLQDVVVRRKRMQGIPTLWLPGTDHAGIATQNVVEREIAKEGLTRHDLGRERFIERTWEWKEQYGSRIIMQLKRLGASCDWSRERFTLDEPYTKAVREVFVRLHEEGLIYRGDYIVNWCPRCRTALSDIEVEYKETEGNLWYIRYPIKDSAEYVVVATTRPETMLGDTGVAVNPEDVRYGELIGLSVILPLVHREIPIVADEFVDPEFGTGAVKVTPAHDPNDFEIGNRHNLERIVVMNPEGIMNDKAGAYAGLDRYEARSRIVADLEAQGLLDHVEEHTHSVGHCYRCDTAIEPYLSKQWFVSMKPLAVPAIEAVEEGRIRFTPSAWTKTYFDWMRNIRDWCISRQIWWGHQIPAWYCRVCDETIVAYETPRSCPLCGGPIEQDPDVLDTWFSSALWPFATLGWPEQTEDLQYFYPTSLLATSHDIIYFWVARMIITGLHFRGERPFSDVYIHALIRDSQGRKMSKSRGNVIDPLDIIEKFGTDALRFTLTALATPGRDVFLSEERIEGMRNFANKIWNASRFVLMNLEGYEKRELDAADLDLADRWILSRLNGVVSDVDAAVEEYNFAEASRLLYDFFWSDFADWYVELAKARLYRSDSPEERAVAQNILVHLLDAVLRLLHPFMPFITEEIWLKLPDSGETIVKAAWPASDKALIDRRVEADFELVQSITSAVRSIKSVLNIPLVKKVKAILMTDDEGAREFLRSKGDYITGLAFIEEFEVQPRGPKPPTSAIAVEKGIEIYVPLEGLVDIAEEKARLSKELAKLETEREKVAKKLSNQGFLAKAAEQVIERERSKQAEIEDKIGKIKMQVESV
ncbi:MAG: valine--tRNA ligase [Candidatus Aquicultorales bacterium]